MSTQTDILVPGAGAGDAPRQTLKAPRAIPRPLLGRLVGRIARNLSPQAGLFCSRQSLRAAGLKGVDSIPTWTKPQELVALYKLAAACPKGAHALEIGSYLGASTCYIAAGLAHVGGTLTCVDTWQNQTMPDGERDTYAEFLRNVAAIRERLILYRNRSEDLEPEEFTRPFHLIFLDGDHSYEAVRRDFQLAVACLPENGIIAFHDILFFPGVARAVGEAFSSGHWTPIGQIDNLIWIARSRPQEH